MTHGSSSGDGGGIKVIRVVKRIPLPNWLKGLQPYIGTLKSAARTIQRAGSLQNLVKIVIAGWVVSGILTAGEFVASQIMLVFHPLLNALGLTEAAIIEPLRTVGTIILDFMRTITDAVVSVTGVAGPAAPVITLGFATITLYLLYRLTVSILGEVPVLSTVVDFLGVRP